MKTLLVSIVMFSLLSNICDRGPFDPAPGTVVNNRIIFYADTIGLSTKEVYTLHIQGTNLTKIIEYGQLPVWYKNKTKILYMDKRTYQIKMHDMNKKTSGDSTILSYHENLDFMRYSKPLNCLLFQYREEGQYRIAKIDLNSLMLEDIGVSPYHETNPVTSDVDDWIYFSTIRESTYDIYRMKMDRSQLQPVLIDAEYNYHTFSVSADGKYIVTPKYNETKSYLVIYEIEKESERIIYESNNEIALYATMTQDNQYVIFINGIPYDYSTPREIFRINFDGTNLIQLTQAGQIIGRPLAW